MWELKRHNKVSMGRPHSVQWEDGFGTLSAHCTSARARCNRHYVYNEVQR